MENRETEKNWNSFWISGRVDDYLSYRNSVRSEEEQKKELRADGTVSDCDRDGTNSHAHIGI